MPDKKQPQKLSTNKNQFIVDKIKAFQELISRSALVLNAQIIKTFLDQLGIDEGTISDDKANMDKVLLIDKAFQLFRDSQGIQVLTTFATDMQEIMQLGKDYYIRTIGSQAKGTEVDSIINRHLGIDDKGNPKPGGYLFNVSTDPSVQGELKKTIFNQVSQNPMGYNDLKKVIKNFIVGTDQEPGAYYQQYERLAFDTYSEVDRLNSKLHADRLNLQHFIFNGGLVKDSRYFCRHNNGKVFSTEQADDWKNHINEFHMIPGKVKAQIKEVTGPIWPKGEESTYVPVLHMGGIKCRHSADYISPEVADFMLKKHA